MLGVGAGLFLELVLLHQENDLSAAPSLEGHGALWSVQFLALLAHVDSGLPQEARPRIH